MAYGIQVSGQNLTSSSLSVVAKGSLPRSTASPRASYFINVFKSNYPEITEYQVVFIATGVRDILQEEVRPIASQTSSRVTLTQPALGSPHQYLVLGR